MTFTATRLVEFRDTDAAGILHFTAYFAYMESVEHEFLRSLGTSVMAYDEQGKLSWPRVAASCDYQQAVRFEDELEIRLIIGRLGNKSVTYEFEFSSGGAVAATGTITTVCCRMSEDGPQSTEIPQALAAKMQPHVVRSES